MQLYLVQFFCSLWTTMIYNLRINLESRNTGITTVRTCKSHFSHQAGTGCRMIHSVHYSWQIHLYLSVEILSQLYNKRPPVFPSVSSVILRISSGDRSVISRLTLSGCRTFLQKYTEVNIVRVTLDRDTVCVYKYMGIALPRTLYLNTYMPKNEAAIFSTKSHNS